MIGLATSFNALCTDFYINQKLALKMDLPTGRETVLDLFDRIRKFRPGMSRFHRYDGELALESAQRDGQYDWVALRQTAARSGTVNPESLADAYQLHRLLLEVAPFYLSISPLDVDYLELMFGFDLEAPGNHDDIVFEALFAESPLGRVVDSNRLVAVDVQPYFTFALDPERKVQVNFEVKTRATESECVEEAPGPSEGRLEEPISVFLSLRPVGPIASVEDLPKIFETLASAAEQFANERVIPHLIMPINKAISSRSR